jgi:hypothetical protein
LRLLAFLWIFIIIAAIVTVFSAMYYSEKYRLYSNWSGLVQGRKTKECYYKGQHRTVYLLQILKDTGERITLETSEETYKSIDVGDKVVKEKGQYQPTRSV